ncbi:inovirus-type Gp2 protein [Paraburkholderia metrosideri]|uniref:Inovirus Gp2 family protein n=1 Tax=Paraburkholderia metrosideri TaxID=580937 RepID=A0ABN7I9N8_9BURK|nr:inovirus-type Gp2 protein [Paraburkholderia metrosideri]CAD6557029.1 hypothetical protein LMG28140_06044 [Paraburkholderia metrosideri]
MTENLKEGIEATEERHNFDTETKEIDSGCVSMLNPDDESDFSYLFEIEQMVDRIREYKQPGFRMRSSWFGSIPVEPLTLAKRHYKRLGEFIRGYSSNRFYAPRIKAFYDACRVIGILDDRYLVPRAPNEYYGSTGKLYAEIFNELIEKIRETCQSRGFKEQLRYLKDTAKRNEAKGLEFEAKMYEWKSRHLILVLHFGYKPEHRKDITEDDIRMHRNRFFNNRRTNRLLRGINGYIWKIERGEDSGLHLHLILFYSAEYRKDVIIGKMIGDYWVRVITNGKGAYWNSNANKEKHNKWGYGDGTGLIKRGDTEKRHSLRKTIRYLAKTHEQCLLMKDEEHFRTFDVSQVPEKMKAGRPRNEKVSCDQHCRDECGDGN